MKCVLTIFVILVFQFEAFGYDEILDTESCSVAKGKKITRYLGDNGSVFVSELGITHNGEFFPFGHEEVVDDDRMVGLRTNDVVETRIAFDLRREQNAIVFVEAYRRPMQKGQSAGYQTWAKSFVSSDFSEFPLIYKFKQNVLRFDGSGKIARSTSAWINHYDIKHRPQYEGGVPQPNLVTPEVTIEQLRDPNLLSSSLYKEILPFARSLDRRFGYIYEDILSLSSCQP